MFHLFTKIDSISTSELEAKLREPIQLLDVRTPTEFKQRSYQKCQECPSIRNRILCTSDKRNTLCHLSFWCAKQLAAKKLKKKATMSSMSEAV